MRSPCFHMRPDELAERLAYAFDFDRVDASRRGNTHAIRTEILLSVMRDRDEPTTLRDLLRALQPLGVGRGEVAEELLTGVERAASSFPESSIEEYLRVTGT
ncbi:MAG: hypothetical protein GY711_02305 [bacterium]|nr:hypothetical protein [bacterium]